MDTTRRPQDYLANAPDMQIALLTVGERRLGRYAAAVALAPNECNGCRGPDSGQYRELDRHRRQPAKSGGFETTSLRFRNPSFVQEYILARGLRPGVAMSLRRGIYRIWLQRSVPIVILLSGIVAGAAGGWFAALKGLN
jgi:hypothetical protein